MRILLWHGYQLTGSGSNVYTANLARAWRAEGHDVLILCQERKAASTPFVDRTGDFNEDNSSFSLADTASASAAGSCWVARPDIEGLLPVFVYDDYEGFEVKLFVDLSESELASYTERNVVAMIAAIKKFRPDAIITGHEVMGPEIARRATEATGTSYVAKLHGSGLEYAVKLQDRYSAFAADGLGAAAAVVGGSEYMVREASAVVPGWSKRAVVVNPGCDVELFKPQPPEPHPVARVAFVGKLIASKGVHHLLAALGLTKSRELEATIVGYGGFERVLHELASVLRSGDLERARSIAEAGESGPMDDLISFLDAVPAGYFDRIATIPVEFTGRLEHIPLAEVLPRVDVLVVPSVVPEAFGMVAAEAAACGTLPVVPDHSGIAEAGRAIEEAIGAPGLLTYPATDPIAGIAAAIDRVLDLPPEERRRMEEAAVELARDRWAWERVADRLLTVAVDAL